MLKIAKETGKELICFCPHHKDEGTPNLHILKVPHNGFPAGFAKCFACGWAGQISPEEVNKMSKRSATKASTCENKKMNWKKIYKDSLEYPECLNEIASLATEWDVSPSAILSMGMGWSHDYNAYTGLMYDENWDVIGIQLRAKDGFKWCVEGSQMGLILPNYDEGNIAYQLKYPAVICEGRSDSVIAHNLGYFAIGRPSAMFGQELILAYMKNNNIKGCRIVADSDKIGKRSADLLSRFLQYEGINCDVLNLYKAKDLREYYELNGKERTQEILKL